MAPIVSFSYSHSQYDFEVEGANQCQLVVGAYSLHSAHNSSAEIWYRLVYSHSVTKTNIQIGGRGLEQITQPRKKRRKQLALTSALTSKALGQLILCCEERDAEDADGRKHVPVPRPPPARLLLAG